MSSEFTIQLRDECADAIITASTAIESFSYAMGQGPLPITLEFDQSISSCSSTFEAEYYDSSSDTWNMMDTNIDYITSIDAINNVITIDLEDNAAYLP